MTTKPTGNIFETLSNNDSSEEEPLQVVKSKDPTQKRVRTKKNKQPVESTPLPTAAPVESKQEVNKAKHPNDEKKDKKVSAEPHPLDKHSGTGRGKEMRKGGAGKSNWGTFQDDLKEEGTTEVKTDEVKLPEEEVDTNLTLSELLAQKNKRQVQSKEAAQAKKEMDLKDFKKDKCELIQTKQDIDDFKTGGKKTTKVKEMYQIINKTENAELLGITTNLKTYSEKPKVEGEKEERPQRPQRQQREQKEQTEGDNQQSGEQKPREQREQRQKKPFEKQGYQKPSERKTGYQGKGQGNQQNRPNLSSKANVNMEDTSSFPTLG